MRSERRVGLKHLVYRLLFTGSLRPKPCNHLHLIQVLEPATRVCADCVALGDRWPALRQCLICGYVGCCNEAKNQHALKHYQATGHSLMRSIERGDDWLWCYVDKALLHGIHLFWCKRGQQQLVGQPRPVEREDEAAQGPPRPLRSGR